MSEISGRLGGERDADDWQVDEASFDVVDEAAGRWLRRHHAGGVAVLTTWVDGALRGTTLSAWIVASVQPLQVLLSLEDENPMLDWVEASGSFALSLLAWQQQFTADQFAGFAPRASSRYELGNHFVAATGAPILSGSPAWVDCRVDHSMRIGDHVCLVGSVEALGRGEGDDDDPLIYYRNRYRRLGQR